MPEPRTSRPLLGWIVLALWIAAIALGYAGLGAFLDESVTGITPEQRSRGLAATTIAVALAALVATILWARGLWGGRSGDEAPAPGLGRRRFLVGTAASLGGLVATAASTLLRPSGWVTTVRPALFPEVATTDPNPQADWRGARVRAYRRLGRTNFEVSDISLGSGRIRGEKGERLAREAIVRGVNYFDTSPDYSEEGSELALGRAMKGKRDRMFLATKFCTPQGHLQAGSSVAQYMEVVEASLGRLQTDYVDLVHVHACDTVDRLRDPNLHEAFGRLKEQGKARFLGFSSHTPNLERVANAAIDDGRFDVMMLAYHHGAWPNLGQIVDRAAASDMGVVAMKTLKGAHHRGLVDLRPETDSYAQAAFKWVLANPSVACLVISFFEPEHVDEYLYASGGRLSEADLALLEKYDRLIAGRHCFQHCGACLESCPEQLPIDDVLRYRMYFESYGDQKEAMRLYARLRKQADVCVGCSAPCVGACPHGVPIQERTVGAHELLHFG
jgi:predicted aldo/keto reductase-like oxidoreductase